MPSDRARRSPDALALDDGRRQRSWAELDDRVRRAARLLRDTLGLRPGDHAAALLHNRVECVELMHAAIQAGVWLTPVNWHLTEDDVDYVVRDSATRVLFADDAHAELAERCLGRLRGGPSAHQLGEAVRAAPARPLLGKPHPTHLKGVLQRSPSEDPA